MNIKETKESYKNNKIDKNAFITGMHKFHEVLFDLSNNLRTTEISKIEINDSGVIFTSRETNLHPGGAKFYVDVLDKRITPLEAFNFDQYEKEDSDMLYNLVSDNDVIFDIGANIGWYSNHLAKKLSSAQIHSFEPIPETFNQLLKNVKVNNVENVKVNNLALSDEKKILTFFYSPTQTGASSSINITENSEMIKLVCQTSTIDAYIEDNNINQLDFIKCDVEGAEFFVFKGGSQAIEKYTPIVFSEMLRKWAAKFGYHPNDIIDFFNNFGYCTFVSSEGKLVKIYKVTEETNDTNFFFLHPIKHKMKIDQLS